MGQKISKCKLCFSKEIKIISENWNTYHWVCEQCGEVLISRDAYIQLTGQKENLWLLSAYCRKRSKSGLPPTTLNTSNLENVIKSMVKPASVLEAQYKVIEFYGESADLIGSWIQYDKYSHLEVVVKRSEMEYLIKTLYEQGILEIYGGLDTSGDFEKLRLTPKGWGIYDEIHRRHKNSQIAFIAMNFDSDMLPVYIDAIKPAVEKAGFIPYRIDQDRHIDNINNRILAKIRECGFLIAEFTGHKHGVYFEAGFAMGLEIPVIWLCKKSDFGKIHFDTKPFNHILWDTKEQLNEELYWFIKANIHS